MCVWESFFVFPWPTNRNHFFVDWLLLERMSLKNKRRRRKTRRQKRRRRWFWVDFFKNEGIIQESSFNKILSLSAFESYISLIGFQSPAPFAIFSDSVVAVQRFKVNASKTYQSEDRWTIIKMQMRFGSLRFFSRYFYEQLEYITIT